MGWAFQHADFLIIGGGLASASAAEALRVAKAAGSIVMLCAEALPPYHRPPLSKGYLTGDRDKTRLFVHPESFYRERGIELRLSTSALGVDAAKQIVTTTAGEIGYGQLLIATGAAPKPWGAPGASLPGLFHLQTKADADAIRRAAQEAKHAIVAGGSFLGMEIAVALKKLGLEVSIMERGAVLLPYLQSAALSAYFKRFAEDRGIGIFLDDRIAAIEGEGKVQEIETASGKRLPCELAVAAIGVSPVSKFLQGSGIGLENGYVAVDEFLRTNLPNIYAAGDVTSFFDPVFAKRRHIEHWDNAVKQGRLAAYNMLGQRRRYDEVSYFFYDLGDVSFDMLGAPEEADEWVERGSLKERSYGLFYLKNNILRALFSVGRPPAETRSADQLIRYRTNLSALKQRLHDPDFALETVPAQTALILQGGGAMGAFECGVVKALEEEKIYPDIVAGVSIGAFNGAIIAGNPRNAAKTLEAFWQEISVPAPALVPLPVPFSGGEKAAIAMSILTFGVPKLFKPRWIPFFGTFGDLIGSPLNWTSFYDPSPMRALIAKYVDFASLKASPVRLLIGAVNVATAELEIFDSYVDDLTPDHIMASGSLPPGFPWTVIDGKAYWDGGILSNSPLDFVIERSGPEGKRVFIVDLYAGHRPLPANMMEVFARRDEIVYSERVKNDLGYRETVNAYRALVNHVLTLVKPEDAEKVKQWPEYIQLMGEGGATSIVRFTRPGREGEQLSRDYDFSESAIRSHLLDGYTVAKRSLSRM